MKWSDTVASRCRYGEDATEIFGDADIIAEASVEDWQGHANVLAAMPDGTFAHYEWTYGSCSGCDEWEDRNLDHGAIVAEMRSAMAVFPDVAAMERYLRVGGDVPTSNTATNGSVPGMLRVLTGEASSDFTEFGKAFVEWKESR